MKNFFKKLGKVVLIIICAIVILMVIGAIFQAIFTQMEKDDISNAYGQSVDVFGENMQVDIVGNGKDVVVLLPGAMEVSPILSMQPLAKQLSEIYTVVTVEYFGYGLSDQTDRPRTLENITEELHECLSELEFEEYTLIAHSLSGVTSLYYANQYPNSVTAIVGIDPSVPAQNKYESGVAINLAIGNIFGFLNDIGLMRAITKFNPDSAVPTIENYTYSKSDIDLYRKISLANRYNSNVMDEMANTIDEFAVILDMKIPKDIPVLFFLSDITNEQFHDMGAPKDEWYNLHAELIKDNKINEIVMLDGSHYLHYEYGKEITSRFNEWYQKIDK